MFLQYLQAVADSTVLLSLAVGLEVVCLYTMNGLVDRLTTKYPDPQATPPDLRFGYTSQELNAFYDTIGVEGCQTYYKYMVLFDLFPYMSTYSVLLGALLYQQIQESNHLIAPKYALIFPFAMCCDVLETIIPAVGCELYASSVIKAREKGQPLTDATIVRLPEYAVLVSAGANQFKWILFAVGLLLLSCLFLYNTLVRPIFKKKTKPTESKKDD